VQAILTKNNKKAFKERREKKKKIASEFLFSASLLVAFEPALNLPMLL
jgi:hypothetical protein